MMTDERVYANRTRLEAISLPCWSESARPYTSAGDWLPTSVRLYSLQPSKSLRRPLSVRIVDLHAASAIVLIGSCFCKVSPHDASHTHPWTLIGASPCAPHVHTCRCWRLPTRLQTPETLSPVTSQWWNVLVPGSIGCQPSSWSPLLLYIYAVWKHAAKGFGGENRHRAGGTTA